MQYDSRLIPLARKLRKEATRQEQHLWYDFLRRYPVKFRRQRPVKGYIADFCCHSALLVIEIDGGQHFTEDGIAEDIQRTKSLEQCGLKVIRFTNQEIDRNFEGVCLEIDRQVQMRLKMYPDISRRAICGKCPYVGRCEMY